MRKVNEALIEGLELAIFVLEKEEELTPERRKSMIESFWALLKRGIVGQFHKVSLRYLPRYIDEFCYRSNHRFNDDLFSLTIQRGLGV